jgi:hypothetical protein
MIVDDEDDMKKPPIKDVPRPRLLDGETERWLERHCGFRPIGVEW